MSVHMKLCNSVMCKWTAAHIVMFKIQYLVYLQIFGATEEDMDKLRLVSLHDVVSLMLHPPPLMFIFAHSSDV
jgi:hypothetical protein